MEKKYKPKQAGNMIGRSRFQRPQSKLYNLQSYGLKNFKSWKDSGLIDFKRVNLIFGQNSAGKSALLQSILTSTENLDNLIYEKNGIPEFLELLSKTIDLGDFSQVHRANKTNNGIFIIYKNNSANIILKAEYSEDPDTKKPKLKSYEFLFKASPFVVSTMIQRKNASSRDRYATSRRGAEKIIYLEGSIKIKTKKMNDALKKELEPIGRTPESVSLIDCSSFSLKEEEGSNSGFSIPKLDKIILASYRSYMRSGIGMTDSFLTGKFDGKTYTSEPFFREDNLHTDWNLEFLGRIIQAAERVFVGRFVHIPPIRGIPARISTTQDITIDPSVAYVYSKYMERGERMMRPRLAINRSRPQLNKDELLKKSVDKDLKDLGMPYSVDVMSDSFNGAALTNIKIIDDNKKELSLLDVGRGISQLLPIIVSAHSETGASILVEQPEVHIHPKLQADLADIFVKSDTNQWLIETHSENVLFRIQKRIREGVLDPSEVQCIYVSTKDGSATPIIIGFNKDGSLNREFPPGFFDIGLEELIP